MLFNNKLSSFFEKYSLYLLCLFIALIILFLLSNIKKINFINTNLFLTSFAVCIFLIFFLWFKKIKENSIFKKFIIELSQILFPVGLISVTILNLNNLVWATPSSIRNINQIISIFLIFSGFLNFYNNRKEINKKVNEELNDKLIKKQKNIFNFNQVISTLKNVIIKYIFNKTYSINFLNILALALIVMLGFILRIWNLNYLQASDNFNLMSAKSLYDNGLFLYKRNIDITYMLAFLFKIFGSTLFIARIPFVIIGAISTVLIYFLGKTINTKIALISAFLLAVSPVAIEKSSFVREYDLNMLLGLIFITIILRLFNQKDKQILRRRICQISFMAIPCLYIYGQVFNNETINIIIFTVALVLIPTIIYYINNNYNKRILLISILILIAGFVGFIFLIPRLGPFSELFGFEPFFFQMFFNPNVSYPVQWFSGSKISELLILAIFILPITTNNKVIKSCYFAFFISVAVFVFKFQNNLAYLPSRYLYHLYPLYIIILSTGIYMLFLSIKKNIYYISILAIFIFSQILIIQNTTHAAKHDLDFSTPDYNRQITSVGSRADVSKLLEYLKENNLIDKEVPLVLDSLDPTWFTFYFQYNIDSQRTFSDKWEKNYEISKNIFLQNYYWEVFDLNFVVKNNKKGTFITRSWRYPDNIIMVGNTTLKLEGSFENFNIFVWDKSALKI
jgi:hypothetical protein